MPEREKLVELAKHRTTLVIFLSAQVIHKIVEDLRSAYPGDTPVAVIHRISWPDEKVLRGTLANIAEKVIEAEVYMTAIVIVGQALTAKGHKSKLYDEKFSHSFRRAKK
jgi:precorrin-4/cobalt-precorrin-4 C11-methyltransferase